MSLTWWFIPGWVLLLAAGMPVAFSLAVISAVFLISQDVNLYLIAQRMVMGPDSFPLLAVPFFILAGSLMNNNGITTRIFNFARSLVGFIPGGLGHVNVVASMIFSGMSGSAVADAAGLGVMEIKEMVKEDYTPEFSAAITAASATIGPIVPPSIPMVIFGVLSGASVGRLFLGGFIPGILMGLGLMAVVFIIARREHLVSHERFSIKALGKSFVDSFWALLTPGIIMGGIIFGVFTPTEAAIVTVFYALLISALFYRSLTTKAVKDALVDTIEFTANIMLIVAAARLFGWVLTRSGVPQDFTRALMAITTNPQIAMLLVTALVLFLGMVMEGIAVMMILVPVLMPVTQVIGIDPVHLGVVFVLVLMIGLITPPFAVNIMIVSGIAKVSFDRVVVALVPFIAVLVLVALAVALIPDFVMFLPRLMN
jgi:tripartite ATP-independent transporter DctM subunit